MGRRVDHLRPLHPVGQHDNVWLVDRNTHEVHKYTGDGKHIMPIGQKGVRSDTGVDPEDYSSTAFQSVTPRRSSFNMPLGIALNDAGEIFIADGYANARVHKFTPQGQLIKSWGEPGDGPGQFRPAPTGVWIDRQGQVLVADRENDRVQVFTQEGEYISTWPSKLIGPALLYVDSEDIAYIPEHNGGLFSVLSPDGEIITQWGSELHAPAMACGPTPAATSTLSCPASGAAAAASSNSTPVTPVSIPHEGRGACESNAPFAMMNVCCGAVAHSGERFNGIEEVEGSIPSSSTTPSFSRPSSAHGQPSPARVRCTAYRHRSASERM